MAKPKLKPGTFTIREVEKYNPCSDGYVEGLISIKSLPTTGAESTFPYKKSRYGPDEPIAIADIAELVGTSILDWLCEQFLIQAQREAIYKRRVELQRAAFARSVIEVLSPRSTKSSPKGKKKK